MVTRLEEGRNVGSRYPASGLHGRVVHEIGGRIVGGGICPGDTLPSEGDLADTYGASRSAIREAIKVLAAKGLVEPRRRSGTRVRPRESWNLLDPDVIGWLPPDELAPEFRRDLVELRLVIEPAAAELAALRSTAPDQEAIRRALDAMAAAGDDGRAFFAADVQFHLAVFRASRNVLIERLDTLIGALLTMSFQAQARRVQSFAAAVEDHRAVYRAIVGRDRKAARAAMEEVMRHGAQQLDTIAAVLATKGE
jgi:DNA-binding FadR family transcriptional regulator